MKPPSCVLICCWIKSSWQVLLQKIINTSFLSYAITTSIDGSDDDQSHCFKEGQPCAEGRSKLDEEMKRIKAGQLVAEDPFASDDDSEEIEENEIVIDPLDIEETEHSEIDSGENLTVITTR